MLACAVPAKFGAIAKKVSDILASSTEIPRIAAPSASRGIAFLRCREDHCARNSAHLKSAENLSCSRGIASGRYTFAVLAVQCTPDVPRGSSQLALQAQ
jgi:hypothetical protein